MVCTGNATAQIPAIAGLQTNIIGPFGALDDVGFYLNYSIVIHIVGSRLLFRA
jgi:hypothetical protein